MTVNRVWALVEQDRARAQDPADGEEVAARTRQVVRKAAAQAMDLAALLEE